MKQIILGACLTLFITACKEKTSSTSSSASVESIVGNYVTADYFKRAEGYDWVAVLIQKTTDSTASIEVKSRSDKKKPTCTFKGNISTAADGFVVTDENQNQFSLTANQDSLYIKPLNGNEQILLYYCSGGGSLQNTYVKLKEALDETQFVLFKKELEYAGIKFNVVQLKDKISIDVEGLTGKDTHYEQAIEGNVYEAEVGDLDIDGSPELMIYWGKNDALKKREVTGYSVNNKASMSFIYLPPISDDKELNKGFNGKNEFAIIENSFAQRFPIFNEDGTTSGKTRQIQYKLVKGEAGKMLKKNRVSEF